MSYFHALLYMPVHKLVFWFVLVEWTARLILFVSLRVSCLLIARELSHVVHPFVAVALLFISPTIPGILGNSSDALFALLSSLAFWQMLAFSRTWQLSRVVTASTLVGLSALCRNDRLVLVVVMATIGLLVTLLNCRQHQVRSALPVLRVLAAAALPFGAIVGGYVIVVGLITGNWATETIVRTYFAFEQAEGFAYNPTAEGLIEGVFEARRLYGSPDDNGYSVISAIGRNPMAFLRRLAHLPVTLISVSSVVYGGALGILIFVLAFAGVTHLIRKRMYSTATVMLWPAHVLVYLVVFARAEYLLMPFFVVYALAAVGVSRVVSAFAKVNYAPYYIVLLSTILACGVVGSITGDGQVLAAMAIVAVAVTITWIATRKLAQGNDSAKVSGSTAGMACLLALMTISLLLKEPFSTVRLPTLGLTGEERAIAFMATHFPRATLIGSLMPREVLAAKMTWQPMVWDASEGSGPAQGRFQELTIQSEADLDAWIARTGVKAIYLDDLLLEFQPRAYEIIERQIGHGLTEVFATEDARPDRLEYYEQFGIEGHGRFRVIAVDPTN